MDKDEVGQRLRLLRSRTGFSVREVAKRSGVTATMISCVERGKNSPSLTTLHKILVALGTDMASFFSRVGTAQPGPVFRREHMPVVMDVERSYTIVFPRRRDIRVEMLDEQILPVRQKPEFSTHRFDVAVCVISGVLTLQIQGQAKAELRPGDAVYIPKGKRHRGYATTEPVRLISVCSPPRY